MSREFAMCVSGVWQRCALEIQVLELGVLPRERREPEKWDREQV